LVEKRTEKLEKARRRNLHHSGIGSDQPNTSLGGRLGRSSLRTRAKNRVKDNVPAS